VVKPVLQTAVEWAQTYEGTDALKGASEHPYFNIVPMFQAAAVPGAAPATFAGKCFQEITVQGAALSDDGTSFDVSIDAQKPASKFCEDNFFLMTTSGFKFKGVFFRGEHKLTWKLPEDAAAAEKYDLATKGVRFFLVMTSMAQWTANLAQTALLFEGEALNYIPERAQKRNIDFMEHYTEFKMPAVPAGGLYNITKSEIRSGDFFGIIRLDGLDPMLAWGMGSTTGHTTTAIWGDDGELYVAESTVTDAYWPDNGVQIHAWDEWIELTQKAGFNLVHVPLSDEAAAKYDAKAAMQFFRDHEGLDYGYRTLLWGWIDTLTDNYPCLPDDFSSMCLHWELIETLFALVDRHAPALADQIWIEAFNHRVGTTGLRTSALWQEADKQNLLGVGAKALPSVVEQDAWDYSTTKDGTPTTGKSMVCCVFVCHMWKAGGLFDDLEGGADAVNCGELTNVDDYRLSLFTGEYKQIGGDWQVSLNDYNQDEPYAHMDEHCESLAPHYERTDGC